MSSLKKFNTCISGHGTQPMMFAHGYGCDQNMWRFVAPAFEEDFKLVLFDHIGAGNSDSSFYKKEKYASLHGYADDVLEICEELGLQQVIYVGHSVSAMIGVLAAIKSPSVFSRLVLVAPSPCYINHDGYIGGFSREDIDELLVALEGNYLGWSTNIAPVIMGNPERPALAEELSNSFCRTDPDIAKNFAKATFLSDNRQDLSKLTVPALILQCSNDLIAPNEVGRYLKANISQSSLVEMKAKGHCPNLSAPDETIDCIKSYLSNQGFYG
jgi:sigma-B regulation protein RsbQ